MAIKKQSPPSFTPAERKTLQEYAKLLERQIIVHMPTTEEMCTNPNLQPLSEKPLRGEAVPEIPAELKRQIGAIMDRRHQNMLAAIASVREDKRNLYSNPAVRWWIEHAQRRANVHGSDVGKDFFKHLALAVRAGLGRDRRMEKGFDRRGAEWVEYSVRRLRRQGKGWGTIASELNLQVDEAQLRRWTKRRRTDSSP